MTFEKKAWLGKWENFETYLYSSDLALQNTWAEVEKTVQKMLGLTAMFSGGAKQFWQTACRTVTETNPARLGGWIVEECEQGLVIDWLAEDGSSLGKRVYRLKQIVEKGLEGKENLLLEAVDAVEGWPFRYLLAMPPMEGHAGLLSHLHFQFGAQRSDILRGDTLRDPRWYATMCAAGTPLERCNLVRALHRMPPVQELP